MLRRQTESFEEKSRGKTRCGGSGRWRDIPKGSFRAIGGYAAEYSADMNREKRRFKKHPQKPCVRLHGHWDADGRFAVIAKGLDSFNLL